MTVIKERLLQVDTSSNDSILRIQKRTYNSEIYFNFELFHYKMGNVEFSIRRKNLKELREILNIDENICPKCKKTICKNCKGNLDDKALFCPTCGERVG